MKNININEISPIHVALVAVKKIYALSPTPCNIELYNDLRKAAATDTMPDSSRLAADLIQVAALSLLENANDENAFVIAVKSVRKAIRAESKTKGAAIITKTPAINGDCYVYNSNGDVVDIIAADETYTTSYAYPINIESLNVKIDAPDNEIAWDIGKRDIDIQNIDDNVWSTFRNALFATYKTDKANRLYIVCQLKNQGYNQSEIASIMSVTHQYISQCLADVKKVFKNTCK